MEEAGIRTRRQKQKGMVRGWVGPWGGGRMPACLMVCIYKK